MTGTVKDFLLSAPRILDWQVLTGDISLVDLGIIEGDRHRTKYFDGGRLPRNRIRRLHMPDEQFPKTSADSLGGKTRSERAVRGDVQR